MTSKVVLNGLRIYAYHGVDEQEGLVGAYFTIDAEVEGDFGLAIAHDKLEGTVNYADLCATIRREMAHKCQLVEHAAGRIAQAILNEQPLTQCVRIRLIKEHPPVGACCEGAGVEITMERTALNLFD